MLIPKSFEYYGGLSTSGDEKIHLIVCANTLTLTIRLSIYGILGGLGPQVSGILHTSWIGRWIGYVKGTNPLVFMLLGLGLAARKKRKRSHHKRFKLQESNSTKTERVHVRNIQLLNSEQTVCIEALLHLLHSFSSQIPATILHYTFPVNSSRLENGWKWLPRRRLSLLL